MGNKRVWLMGHILIGGLKGSPPTQAKYIEDLHGRRRSDAEIAKQAHVNAGKTGGRTRAPQWYERARELEPVAQANCPPNEYKVIAKFIWDKKHWGRSKRPPSLERLILFLRKIRNNRQKK